MYWRRSRSQNLTLDWTVLWQDARLRSHLIIAQPGCIDKPSLISVNVCPLISDFPMRWATYCLQNVILYFPQIPLCTVNQMECVNTANISSDCLPPCSGSILTTPLSTGSLYPKFHEQTSGIIQKLYETKTNTNTGWFKSVYWLFSEIKPKMCDFARFHCFSSKNGLNCNMTFR